MVARVLIGLVLAVLFLFVLPQLTPAHGQETAGAGAAWDCHPSAKTASSRTVPTTDAGPARPRQITSSFSAVTVIEPWSSSTTPVTR